MAAVFPSGWTGFLPGSARRVPVAETHENVGHTFDEEETYFVHRWTW